LSRKPINGDAEVRAFLESEAMDQTHDYLARGRVFLALEDDQLRADWERAFERAFATREPLDVRKMDDLSAEARLRKLELPEISEEILQKIQAEQETQPGIGRLGRGKLREFLKRRKKGGN